MSGLVRKRSHIRSAIVRVTALLLYCITAFATTAVTAQSTIDLEPPKIDHNVPGAVKPGKAVRITALVTDDGGIETVTVFYRTTQTGPYQSAEMENIQGPEYTAVVATAKKSDGLQYYIEAVDTGGNRVLEGGPGSPLVVQTAKKSNTLLIAIGGILALGAIAAAGGGDDPESNDPTSRDLSITADIPSP